MPPSQPHLSPCRSSVSAPSLASRALTHPFPYPTPPLPLQIFRFRPLARSTRPLQDAQHYELLRYFLASGSVVAETFYGPMSFDAFGQNQGREPSTMQVSRSEAHVETHTERYVWSR